MANLIQEAILKAMAVHQGEVRKGDGETPYVLHPLEVGITVSHYTTDEILIASAILHDVVETGKVTTQEIQNEFGDGVDDVVGRLTEDQSIKDWAERKGENLRRLNDLKVAYFIRAVDSLVNMKDLFAAIQSHGQNVWDKFNAPRGHKISYFEKVLEDIKEELPRSLLEKYVSALKDLQYSHLIASPGSEIGFRE